MFLALYVKNNSVNTGKLKSVITDYALCYWEQIYETSLFQTFLGIQKSYFTRLFKNAHTFKNIKVTVKYFFFL